MKSSQTEIRRTTTPPTHVTSDLKGVLEARVMFDGFPTSFDSLVRAVELEAETSNSDDDESLGEETGQNARAIAGCVDWSENTGSNDSTDCTTADERR